MQNLKLSIEGQWWDSLLYKGRLHLFGLDGSLRTFDWDRLIDDLAQKAPAAGREALRFSFSESNALYRNVMEGGALEAAFAALHDTSYFIARSELMKYVVDEGDNRFPFPHATSAFYNDRMFVASSEGVHGAVFDDFGDTLGTTSRLTDLPANQAWPAYGTLAVAAGSEGLHEIQLGAIASDWLNRKEPFQVSTRTTEACDWMFQNIVAMSIDGGSFFVRYRIDELDDGSALSEPETEDPDLPTTVDRVLEGEVDLHSRLRENGRSPIKSFVWGSQDKFYRAEDGLITVYRLWQNGRITKAGAPIQMDHRLDDLVSVQTSLFGVVLEFDTGLLVLTSDERAHHIPGEPVNWRAFPRSKRYENHLHVIGEDALCVYSFNQDATVDQYTKRIGSKFYPKRL